MLVTRKRGTLWKLQSRNPFYSDDTSKTLAKQRRREKILKPGNKWHQYPKPYTLSPVPFSNTIHNRPPLAQRSRHSSHRWNRRRAINQVRASPSDTQQTQLKHRCYKCTIPFALLAHKARKTGFSSWIRSEACITRHNEHTCGLVGCVGVEIHVPFPGRLILWLASFRGVNEELLASGVRANESDQLGGCNTLLCKKCDEVCGGSVDVGEETVNGWGGGVIAADECLDDRAERAGDDCNGRGKLDHCKFEESELAKIEVSWSDFRVKGVPKSLRTP